MLLVGLTGGAASGKSTVGRILVERGAALLDADRIVARLYRAGQRGAEAVAGLFGRGLLAADGSVDRRLLALRVLGDPEARQRLEAAVHPLVRAAISSWVGALAARRAPPAVAVVEAALLVETGSFRDYDTLVVVTAPVALRRERALAAGWPLRQFEQTVAAQASDDERALVACHVVANEGDLGELERQVDTLWRRLADQAARATPGRRN